MSKHIFPRTREEIDYAISLPQSLTTEDGRLLIIQKWRPTYQAGKLVTVEIEAIIKNPEKD